MRKRECEKERAQAIGIHLDSDIDILSDDRGIYGIFQQSKSEEECLYIGRSYSIQERLYGSRGHITAYNRGNRDKLTSKLIEKAISNGHSILIKCLKKVPYEGDNYFRDMQRLAYAEITCIEEYQEKKQCLNQLPEGTWIGEANWISKYKVDNT